MRRGRLMGLPTVVAVFVVLAFWYGYYLYGELSQKLQNSEHRLGKYQQSHSSLRSQLQVVYDHRAKLEAALIKERQEHRSTKKEYIVKVKDYNANLTRTKHESINRFNALDTQHKMLKARHDELSSDYSRMQLQYVRLSGDHQKVIKNWKEDYQKLKDRNDEESRALQARVQSLFTETETLKNESRLYLGYYQSEKTERLKLLNVVDKMTAKSTEEEILILESQKNLKNCDTDLTSSRDKEKSMEEELRKMKGKMEDEVRRMKRKMDDELRRMKDKHIITRNGMRTSKKSRAQIPKSTPKVAKNMNKAGIKGNSISEMDKEEPKNKIIKQKDTPTENTLGIPVKLKLDDRMKENNDEVLNQDKSENNREAEEVRKINDKFPIEPDKELNKESDKESDKRSDKRSSKLDVRGRRNIADANPNDVRGRRNIADTNPNDDTRIKFPQPIAEETEEKFDSEGETDFQNLMKTAQLVLKETNTLGERKEYAVEAPMDERNQLGKTKDDMLEVARHVLNAVDDKKNNMQEVPSDVRKSENLGLKKSDKMNEKSNILQEKEDHQIPGNKEHVFMNKQQELLQRPIPKVSQSRQNNRFVDTKEENNENNEAAPVGLAQEHRKPSIKRRVIRSQLAAPGNKIPHRGESVDEKYEKVRGRQLQPPKPEASRITEMQNAAESDRDQDHIQQQKAAIVKASETQDNDSLQHNVIVKEKSTKEKDAKVSNSFNEDDRSDTKQRHSPIKKPTVVQIRKEANQKRLQQETNNALFAIKHEPEDKNIVVESHSRRGSKFDSANKAGAKHTVEDTEQEHGDQNLDADENDQIAEDNEADRQQDDDVERSEEIPGQVNQNMDIDVNKEIKNAVELSKENFR